VILFGIRYIISKNFILSIKKPFQKEASRSFKVLKFHQNHKWAASRILRRGCGFFNVTMSGWQNHYVDFHYDFVLDLKIYDFLLCWKSPSLFGYLKYDMQQAKDSLFQ